MIIFQSSVKHGAVNNLQWEYGSFAPINPICMRGNIPTEADRGKITKKRIMDCLPDVKHCIRGAGIAFALTEFSEDEVYLLHGRKDKKIRRKTLADVRNLGKPLRPRNMNLNSSVLSDLNSGSFPPRWMFTEDEAKTAFVDFQNKLQQIEDEIIERNSKLVENGQVPYHVLCPSRLPSGIAI